MAVDLQGIILYFVEDIDLSVIMETQGCRAG